MLATLAHMVNDGEEEMAVAVLKEMGAPEVTDKEKEEKIDEFLKAMFE